MSHEHFQNIKEHESTRKISEHSVPFLSFVKITIQHNISLTLNKTRNYWLKISYHFPLEIHDFCYQLVPMFFSLADISVLENHRSNLFTFRILQSKISGGFE